MIRPRSTRCWPPARAAHVWLAVGLAVGVAAAAAPVAAGEPAPVPDAGSATVTCSGDWLRQGRFAFASGPTVEAAGGEALGTMRSPVAADPAGADPAGVAAPNDSGAHVVPRDEMFPLQWNLSAIEAPGAWGISYGADDVTIAFIGTGVETDHPDLQPKIWRNVGEVPGNGIDDDGNGYIDDVAGWDFPGLDGRSPDSDPDDIGGRGTIMAGIAAAATNNAIGVAGVSWGARIMPLKVFFEREGAIVGYVRHITEGVCYAVNNGARVIQFGGWLYDAGNPAAAEQMARLREAIEYAHSQGAVLVAAAGDCGVLGLPVCPPGLGANPVIYPAFFDRVIGVQSAYLDSERELRLRSQASFGPWVDLVAPGEGFLSTFPGGGFRTIRLSEVQATSEFAAAHVSGAVAAMLTVNPGLRKPAVMRTLCQSAKRPAGVAFDGTHFEASSPWNPRWGCGTLDLQGAVSATPKTVRVTPGDVVIMTTGDGEIIARRFTNPYLNQGAWTLVANEPWMTTSVVRQTQGAPSWQYLYVHLDRDGLRGQLESSGFVRSVDGLKACPIPDYDPGCQDITVTLKHSDVVERAFLPLTLAGHEAWR